MEYLKICLICLVLSGCGSKQGNPRVRIGNQGTGLQAWGMPFTLADSLGYYKEEGVDVTMENLPSGVKALQALIGGSIDVAGLMYQQTIQMAADGQHVRAFFITSQRSMLTLVVSPATKKKIRSVADLKGALIGVVSQGAPLHQALNFYLSRKGIQPSEFTPISIGFGASSIAAIESGRVDAAGLAGGDHFRLLQRHPDLQILLDCSTAEGTQECVGGDTYAGGALSAKQAWLDKNPDAARKLARALQRTHKWIATHTPQEIRDRLPDNFRSDDVAVDLQIIRAGLSIYTIDGAMPKGAPETMKQFLDATVDKVRDTKIDLAGTWTDEYLGAK